MPANSTSFMPGGQWVEYGYGSAILFLVGSICLVGAHIYAKATFAIFLCVGTAIMCSIVNFFVAPKNTEIPLTNPIR